VTELATTATGVLDESDVAVSVEDLHVRYEVYEDQVPSVKHLVRNGFRSRKSTTVHALKGVSLELHIGEAVGIIGSNGSGKSTFMRTIAGLQSKTSGLVRVRGDIRLLGVGATLKPQLSGHRNVMLGGLAMGLTRDEVEARLPEVAEFSGLGAVLGRPLKTYSSGMRARLAFSIATLTTPDVLLIDEALAVGDRKFRAKSLTRVEEILEHAGTVVMVSHNINEIRSSCSRVVWLEDGVVVGDGDAEELLDRYEEER
jgi:teichoic acid transport system ATP-binding protein